MRPYEKVLVRYKWENTMDLGLKGKKAFITGGSVGIGLAIAKCFAQEGVDVAIGARNRERVDQEAKSISKEYGNNSNEGLR